jgi:DNA-binding MarR family transcriptional regulator
MTVLREIPHDDERRTLVRELALHAMAALRALQHEAQRAFEPLGMRPSQVLVLELIHRGVDQPKVLAEQLETVQSAVSAILGELQGRGLVTRTSDPDDRRRARLQVTDAGLDALAHAGEAWFTASERRVAAVELADLRTIARVARTLGQGNER